MQLLNLDYPEGLILIDEFITHEEHDRCVAAIDELPWSRDIQRRTQHYGSKYDYTTGKAAGWGTAPPPPVELSSLANRLWLSGYFESEPDQIIVNEYLVDEERAQGIGAHIDRSDCFGNTIATISLLEAWAMKFSHDTEPSVEILLPRCSATIMTGSARYEWKHSISPRKSDRVQNMKIPRHRRVSLTFRSLSTKAAN